MSRDRFVPISAPLQWNHPSSIAEDSDDSNALSFVIRCHTPLVSASSGSNSCQESGVGTAAQQVLTLLTRLYAADVDFMLGVVDFAFALCVGWSSQVTGWCRGGCGSEKSRHGPLVPTDLVEW